MEKLCFYFIEFFVAITALYFTYDHIERHNPFTSKPMKILRGFINGVIAVLIAHYVLTYLYGLIGIAF